MTALLTSDAPVLPSFPPGVSLVYHQREEAFYTFFGKQIWRWDGKRWEKTREVISWCSDDAHCGFYDPSLEDVVIVRLDQSKLLVSRLSLPDATLSLADASIAAPRLLAACFDVKAGCALIITTDDDTSSLFALTPRHDSLGISYRFDSLSDCPYLTSLHYDPKRERAFGIDTEDQIYAFDATRRTLRRVKSPEELYSHTEPFWHSTDQAMAVIAAVQERDHHKIKAAGFDCERSSAVHLLKSRGGIPRWVVREPLQVLPRILSQSGVGYDSKRGQLVVIGGQDLTNSCRYTDTTWTSNGGAFKRQAPALSPPVFEAACFGTTGETSYCLYCETGDVYLLLEGSWQIAARHRGGWRDSRSINATAYEKTLWVLDDNGELWCASLNTKTPGRFARVCESEGGPSARYTRRVSMAWDALEKRLVLFGGPDRNDTWFAQDNTWCELRSEQTPRQGIGSMVGTPHGAFLLVGGEAWHLRRQGWTCVATLPQTEIEADDEEFFEWPDDPPLLFDSRRQQLLVVENESLQRLERGQRVEVARFKKKLALGDSYSSEHKHVGLDTTLDSLVVIGSTAVQVFSLSSLQANSAGLPTRSVESHWRRLSAPPAEWERPAANLWPEKRVPHSTLETMGVRIAAGRELVAILAGAANGLQLKKHAGLVVTLPDYNSEEYDNEQDVAQAHFLPLGTPVQNTLALYRWNKSDEEEDEEDERENDCDCCSCGCDGSCDEEDGCMDNCACEGDCCRFESDNALWLAEESPFIDLDPKHAHKVDTPAGNQPEKHLRTKVGGFATYVQEEPNASCCQCGEKLRFAAEFTTPLFMIGDVGSLYVHICPNECEAKAYAQSH